MGDIEDAIRETELYQELFQKPLDKARSEAFAEGYSIGYAKGLSGIRAVREMACRALRAGMPVERAIEAFSLIREASREEIEVIVETVLQDLQQH